MSKSNFNNFFPNLKAGVRNASYNTTDEKFNPTILYVDSSKMGFITEKNGYQIPINTNYSIDNLLNTDSLNAIKNSYALRLALAIIRNFNIQRNTPAENINVPGLNNRSGNYPPQNENDSEIIMIYIKQILIILKNTHLFNDSKAEKRIEYSSFGYIQLYLQLLNSFWNNVKWNRLFPSMPDIAEKLKINRNLLINMMLRNKHKFRIDTISNDFMQTAGFGKENDFLIISFIDFYFFTWLDHFSLISYIRGCDIDPVEIKITAHGRKILRYLATQSHL